MKNLNLEIDLSFTKENERPDLSLIWESFLIAGIKSIYSNGVDLRVQRRIMKMIDAFKTGGTIPLEDAEFDLLKEIKDKGKFDPSTARICSLILERIEEVK